jgi:hypothetical protein
LQEEDMKRQNSMGVPASPNGKFTVDKRLRALKVIAECGGSLTSPPCPGGAAPAGQGGHDG